jgi:hypothetical protein
LRARTQVRDDDREGLQRHGAGNGGDDVRGGVGAIGEGRTGRETPDDAADQLAGEIGGGGQVRRNQSLRPVAEGRRGVGGERGYRADDGGVWHERAGLLHIRRIGRRRLDVRDARTEKSSEENEQFDDQHGPLHLWFKSDTRW